MIAFKAADGLKYYDILEGKGPVAEKGSTVQVWLSLKFAYMSISSSD